MNKDHDTEPVDELQILGRRGPLSQRLGGAYEVRQAQLTMARRVRTALEEGERLVAEAGTGTGKTLAYLVPAVLSGLKVVISTGTKTLQQQIVEKDIPLLLEALGLELRVATMKGISNYLCLRRFHQLRRSGAGLPGVTAPDPHLQLIETWAGKTESGDRAELSDLPDDSTIWAEVSPTPETRLGGRCPYFEECFITKMRRAAAAARIVVVNHHLLLADLSIRSAYPEAGVIPAYEALILDEAHQLEEIATAFFGRSISSEKIAQLVRDARGIAQLEQDTHALKLAETLQESGAELFHLLQRHLSELGETRESGDRLRLFEEPLTGPLLEPYFALDAALEALAMHLAKATAGREEIANLARRVATLREEVSLFADRPHEGYIFWAERRRRSLALHASPVEVGPILRQALLADPIPIVFTSATLATCAQGSDPDTSPASSSPLSYFRGRVGLDEAEAQVLPVTELVLPSPFDFERQTLLYLPRDLPEPASNEFIFRASERMSQLIDITAGRALVLFTSYRNMQAAFELLRRQLSYPILCQGTRPRSVLLDRFRRQVSSVLLATASFWEGVDVVGESLSLVCIDKLPFAVPDEPLTAARMELLEQRGLPPFTSFQLPQALLALKQGFGRLIRHRTDQGVVAILDRRILTKSYGGTLLDNLPPSPRTSDLLRVRAFCKGRLRGHSA